MTRNPSRRYSPWGILLSLLALMGCTSPITFSADIKTAVANGLSQVILKSVTFSNTDPTLGNVPSGTSITATVTMINPQNLAINYTLGVDLDPSFFASAPPASPKEASPTSLSFTFKLLPTAEHHDLKFTLGKVSPGTGKTYTNDSFKVHCDSPPDSIQNLTPGRDNASNSFIGFTLPVAPSDDDLASVILSYQDVSSASLPVTNVTLPVNDPSLVAASAPDVLASFTSATKRYFKPSVTPGHSYNFQITLVDAVGQKSATQSVGTGNIQYTLTYSLNGGTGTLPGAVTYLFGTSATVAATVPTRTGFSFTGWNTQADGSGLSLAPSSTLAMNLGNITLYAQWTYTVAYSLNGASGTAPTGASASSTVALTLPGVGAMTYPGYVLTGWNTAANGLGTGYAVGASYPGSAGSATLYAQWSPNTNTVTFNANGGTGSMANQTIPTGSSASLTLNTFARSGFTFTGWNTVAGGGGTSYTNGQSYLMGSSSVTVYAQWTYTVSYSLNGASGTAPTGASASSTVALTLPGVGAMTYTGYTFAGWNTAANGSGTSYAAGASYPGSAGSTTLYAQWTVNSYTVTYSANGGSGSPPTAVTQNYNTSFTVSGAGSLTLANYTFTGWNTASNGTGTPYLAGSTYIVGASNATLWAQWTVNSYTVTYNANGGSGSPPSSVTQNYNTNFTVSGAGSLINGALVFDGWNTVFDGSGTAYNAGDPFTLLGTGALYAIWLSATPVTLPLAQTVTVPSGVTNLTVTSGTNNMFSTTAIVTATWPTTVVLPSTLTTLGSLAFHDCYGLTSITIPSSVTTLGYGVFLNDSNVTVTMTSAIPPTNTAGAFDPAGTSALVIRVPIADLSAYQTAIGWSSYIAQMVGY